MPDKCSFSDTPHDGLSSAVTSPRILYLNVLLTGIIGMIQRCWSGSVDEIEVVEVPGNEALAELKCALEEADATGFHPILLGDAEDYELILERFENSETHELVIREAIELSVRDWFKSQTKDLRIPPISVGRPAFTDSRIVTHLDLTTRQTKPTVLLAAFKVSAAWHAFARLNWGGWNTCPPAEIHCAVHRSWLEQYGANVISITSNAVQCEVARPPVDRDAAMQLVRDQSLYCPSVVAGASLSDMAARLMKAKYWYFRWE